MSSADKFDPYHQWLGIRAARGPVNFYRLLGLDVFEANAEVIANAADRQMAHVRCFQNGRHADWSQQLLAEIAAARICLLDPQRKDAYDDELSRELLHSGDGPSADGAAFGEYLLLDQLAAASVSTVYKARHRTMQRDVALQTLSSSAATSPKEVKRFRRKAAILARLEHPHLIKAYDAGVRDGVHCLIMELVEGESLYEQLRQRNAEPPAEQPTAETVVEWAKQTAAALAHAHSRRMLHRRVAPSNLLLDRQHGIKVAGWGLALLTDGGEDAAPEARGALVGNIDYVAPEQLANCREIDERADIYGLGCTLWTLLSGLPPFQGSMAEKIRCHQQSEPPPLPHAKADPKLQDIIHCMMSKLPDDRYASMLEVIQALQTWLFEAKSGATHGLSSLPGLAAPPLPIPHALPVEAADSDSKREVRLEARPPEASQESEGRADSQPASLPIIRVKRR